MMLQFSFLKKVFAAITLPLLLWSCNSAPSVNSSKNIDSVQNSSILYQAYCAGCHGAQLQGSVAPALVNRNLKHGSSYDSIFTVISSGITGTEMIRWSNVLSKEKIEILTRFIMQVREQPELAKQFKRPSVIKTNLHTIKVDTLISEELERPYGIEFTDSNRALITSNTGALYWMLNDTLDRQPIHGIPKTYAYDMYGGMMDLALDPDYRNNGWVYLAYSYNKSNSIEKTAAGTTKIVRGKIKDHQWQEEQTLFQVHDSLFVTGGSRWGCRMLFDDKGYLYFSIGDMNRAADAQILTRPSGKIFRIHNNGGIPADNPFYNQPAHLQAIYSWGNRNAQGLAQHPETGVIYESEHGPQGGDELNILKNGANYGWPVITYGIDYNGSIISDKTQQQGMEQPITYWTPSIAVSAIEFVKGKQFIKWKNHLLVAALKFEEIRRLAIDGDKVTDQEILLKGYGRIRDIKEGPEGSLYVLTNAPDAVLKLTALE